MGGGVCVQLGGAVILVRNECCQGWRGFCRDGQGNDAEAATGVTVPESLSERCKAQDAAMEIHSVFQLIRMLPLLE